MTIAEALQQGKTRLLAEPLVAENAARDAELLLMHTLRMGRAWLMAYPELALTATQAEQYAALIDERLTAMPLQYITGEQEFYGLRFRVTPDVLIPRPETEHLVEAVLARVPLGTALEIVDVGTGSGAIAVALAHLLPQSKVTALDLSAAALDVAYENAVAHGVIDRVELLQSDLLGDVASRCFHVVVSNPPYVSLKDADLLHPQVRHFEPSLALFAGETGFEVYERLIPQASNVLAPHGLLAMEIGFGQSKRMAHLLRGWQNVEFVKDLQGIDRVVLARKGYL